MYLLLTQLLRNSRITYTVQYFGINRLITGDRVRYMYVYTGLL